MSFSGLYRVQTYVRLRLVSSADLCPSQACTEGRLMPVSGLYRAQTCPFQACIERRHMSFSGSKVDLALFRLVSSVD